MIQESGKSTVPALHMAFVGNPGTGKTTVAQMTADLLYSMGVIRTDKVITVSALDLLGKYVGQTSGVTRSYCEKAYGGILFIDEAYLISPSRDKAVMTSTARNVSVLCFRKWRITVTAWS